MLNVMAAPEVACVLVNWNNGRDTADCLASLRCQQYPALRVIVVDNGSTDGSLERLRDQHPWATYVAAGKNLGFPKACNLGARDAAARDAAFIWLLNNDTTVPPDTTSRLVAAAEANPQAGAVGAEIFYASEPAKIQAWGGGTISVWTGYNRHVTGPAAVGEDFYLTFACALIRRAAFDQLGGLGEEFFMYFEDSDFCLRARSAGWNLAVAQGTRVLHREGGSADGRSERLEQIVTTSGLLFLKRHSPVPPFSYFAFVTLRLGKRLVSGKWRFVRAVLRGVGEFRGRLKLG